MTPGRVGVVLSSYNRPDGLARAADSLVAQDHGDWVCVVADDHSEDQRVAEVAARLERADPRFRVLRGHPRFTAEQKRRVCTLGLRINEAHELLRDCEFFAYLLDDVVYHPTRLSAHVALLLANPRVFLVWGEQWLVRRDESGSVVEERRQVPERGLGERSQAFLRQRLARGNFINHCSATHRAAPTVRWSTRGEAWQTVDWAFWQDLVAHGCAPFLHTEAVGETMHSGPWDIGPSMHHRGESIAQIARARGGK